MNLPAEVTIVEVGPRDGFQNEKEFIPTERKVEIINMLSATGVSRMEVTSFVHHKWIPQLRDAEEVLSNIERNESIVYSALVPNEKGYDRAFKAGIQQINLVVSASNSHNKNNLNNNTEDTLKGFDPIIQKAFSDGVRIQAIIATSFGCPFEGAVPEDRVLYVAGLLADKGVKDITLADTIGVANPKQVYHLFCSITHKFPWLNFAAHFHDTRALGLANVLAAMEAGITIFDSSLGGLGGCPFAPGAAGNIATEDLVNMFEEMGIKTNMDLDKLIECARYTREVLGRDLPGHVWKAGRKPCSCTRD
ncbi:MAG: hydroxymethylglutaryl-CoA lyase [Bacillota bacterium]